jgi:hypothetical protein
MDASRFLRSPEPETTIKPTAVVESYIASTPARNFAMKVTTMFVERLTARRRVDKAVAITFAL